MALEKLGAVSSCVWGEYPADGRFGRKRELLELKRQSGFGEEDAQKPTNDSQEGSGSS
ncbi:integral membrane protein [Aspergillus luchuensis]|uniref:Integral membrane protein n=1 Tax=Aspergillus kawachii TaxID=1069201 RepID=A0A146FUS5_ASPKA|nr:integral membrane protein [Aspergillus luchuensis]